MAYREVTRVEINEVIRRWQLGMSQRQIAHGTGVSRPTVRRYLAAAAELGLSADGPEPDEVQLASGMVGKRLTYEALIAVGSSTLVPESKTARSGSRLTLRFGPR